MITYFITAVLLWKVFLGIISKPNTDSDRQGRTCFEVLFTAAIIYFGYEAVTWLL